MIVLAVDTSQRVGSVALARDGDLLGSQVFGAESSHLVELGRAVDTLLAAAALGPRDVDRVALVRGPGSFTGLRVGMAYVKGLHAATGAAVVTMGTLELLALPRAGGHAMVCPMVDARRGEVYAALYRAPQAPSGAALDALLSPCAEAPDRFLERARVAAGETRPLVLGSGAHRFRDLVARTWPDAPVAGEVDSLPSTDYLARVAGRLSPLGSDEVRVLEPEYIRPSGAVRRPLRRVDAGE